MTTSNNAQQSQPGPIAKQLAKVQSNGQRTPSNGQLLSIGQPPKKKTNWTGSSDKTLWDWSQLLGVLAIPVVVAFASIFYGIEQNQTSLQL